MIALAAIPALLAAASLFFLRANRAAFRPLPPADGRCEGPAVSIVIPARNEERDLENALRSHRASDYPDLEIVVVDDRSTDATGAILARIAAEDGRVRVVRGEEPPRGWLGKPHALWEGARAARGEWLLFVDADVVYAPEALGRAMSRVLGGRLDFLCLLPTLVTRGFWEGVLMPNLYVATLLGPAFLAASERFRGLAIGGGCGNLVRRTAYDAVGGHEALRDAVIDDVGLAIAVKRGGHRVAADLAFDAVSVRMYRGFQEVVDGFSKNLAFVVPRPAVLAAGLLLAVVLAWAPWVVLFAPRASAAERAVAGLAILLTLAGRAGVARLTRSPLWSGVFHPVMLTVWAWIGARSLYRRVVRREVAWRGRTTPAPR